jgi:hypothetical protein
MRVLLCVFVCSCVSLYRSVCVYVVVCACVLVMCRMMCVTALSVSVYRFSLSHCVVVSCVCVWCVCVCVCPLQWPCTIPSAPVLPPMHRGNAFPGARGITNLGAYQHAHDSGETCRCHRSSCSEQCCYERWLILLWSCPVARATIPVPLTGHRSQDRAIEPLWGHHDMPTSAGTCHCSNRQSNAANDTNMPTAQRERATHRSS